MLRPIASRVWSHVRAGLLTVWSVSVPLLVLMFVGVFLFLQFRATWDMQRRLAVLEATVKQRIELGDRVYEEHGHRLEALEIEVFGYLPMQITAAQDAATSAARRPTAAELWQRNRDSDLRKRISSLEQRLWKLDAVRR